MSLLISMSLFSLSMSISPGPVNIITLSTGVNYGFRKALPFVSGATVGFTLLLLLIGLSVDLIASFSGRFLHLLSYAGCAFILYMGYGIMTSSGAISAAHGKLPTFLQGAGLQWLNPKAWAACLAGVSAFNLSQSYELLAMFVMIYFVICYLSIGSWALLGDRLTGVVGKEKNIRLLNRVMGGALILVALQLLLMPL
ncbi:LysE family translocator [Aestuariirhabdus sp. Z084]|uniref:LysE family translocator n=1 Tax=Aestuariirhabdus haliotis TaxID=2918751 RepID=UPI00201B42EA|nr:LysE family translocator [Aestuariirhabdus haliotis]MCL6414063.1 LysE family translocator [Aestuariirhabdus haliotis]MCL6417996.1 LysE family translocator [Aestuariirhabdus haliotis]